MKTFLDRNTWSGRSPTRSRRRASPMPSSSAGRGGWGRPRSPGSSPRRSTANRGRRRTLQRVRPLPRDHRRDRRSTSARSTAPPTRGRRDPGAPREREVRPRLLSLQGLHHRRGPHALEGGLQRAPEDPRGAAAHVIFIFATTETHKVPATILSRCQSFEFRRIPLRHHRRQPEEDRGGRRDSGSATRGFPGSPRQATGAFATRRASSIR